MRGFAAAILLFLGTAPLGAAAQESDAMDALFPDVAAPAPARPAPAPASAATPDDSLRQLEKRLDALEARLGPATRPPSLANSVERRLADLDARLQKLEQQLTRLQQYDQRIRRLEMK